MDSLLSALSNLGHPAYWVADTSAVLVAAVSGLVPGASGLLVMTIAIPLIIFEIEDPAVGLVILATLTGVNNTLDSIPAVLLGQPSAARRSRSSKATSWRGRARPPSPWLPSCPSSGPSSSSSVSPR